MLRVFQGIREQFPGDPGIHFGTGFLKFTNFYLKDYCFVENNCETPLIGNMFISYNSYEI